jgi:hypothetical protein
MQFPKKFIPTHPQKYLKRKKIPLKPISKSKTNSKNTINNITYSLTMTKISMLKK